MRAINQAYEMDKRSHCALLAHKLVDYKPGWTRIEPQGLALPKWLTAMSAADVREALEAAKPLAMDQIQKIDSLSIVCTARPWLRHPPMI